MAIRAIIVESPTKARTIKGFVGRKFSVLSSKGHVKDLPKSRLGVDVEKEFEPEYIVIQKKRKQLRELKEKVKKIKKLYLACDPDREGEAIAFHLAQELMGGREIYRIVFHEITPDAILKAIDEPGEIDMAMVDAHKARRVLDRLVGYYITPLLWKIIKGGLSAGRVQSVALRLICEREKEIESFTPEPYWSIEVVFSKDGIEFPAVLLSIAGEKRRWNDDDLEKTRAVLKNGGFAIESINIFEKKYSPPPPFITSTLQQTAANLLGFSAKKTMQLAQSLYEGIDLPDGRIGLITYMRTDSTRVADKAMRELRRSISSRYGKNYLAPQTRKFKDRPTAQAAHEAIRPTSIKRKPDDLRDFLTTDQYRLYKLIYMRFLASQMAQARYENKEVLIGKEDLIFRVLGVHMLFDGYQKVIKKDLNKEIDIPVLKVSDRVDFVTANYEKKETKPPPRYSEATLIRMLEKNGIGRPSTYAKIISTIFLRSYIQRKRRTLFPTELGMTVNDVLMKYFDEILAIPFTAQIEEELDKIEGSKKGWQEVVGKFYKPLLDKIERCKEDLDKLRSEVLGAVEKKCPLCGRDMVIKMGRFGKFYACSGFPKCRYTESTEYHEVDKTCPKCGTKLIIRHGKRGRFLSCPRYPECKHTEPLEISTPCPKCGGGMIEQSFGNNRFYRCKKCNYKTDKIEEGED